MIRCMTLNKSTNTSPDPNTCNGCCKAKPPSEDAEPKFPEGEVVQEPPSKANAMVLQSRWDAKEGGART